MENALEIPLRDSHSSEAPSPNSGFGYYDSFRDSPSRHYFGFSVLFGSACLAGIIYVF